MSLTDLEVRKAKASDRPFKMFDSLGLFVLVTPAGGKLWRMKYRIDGKEKSLSFGAYPEVSLAEAREARDRARAELRNGCDPAAAKREAALQPRTEDRFEPIARAWFEQQRPTWTDRHAEDVIGSLEQGIFPALGNTPIKDITPSLLLQQLRKIESRPAVETARRVRQRVSAVFVYAIGSGLADQDPAAIVSGAMAPLKKGRQPALLDLEEVRTMLGAAEAAKAHPVTKLALRLLALSAVRPAEVRAVTWGEFEDLDGAQPQWCIPAERMKMKREHVVPLAPQAVEIITAVRRLTGRCPYVFPNARHAHKPMSENAIGYLLNRVGYHQLHVPHGWRATFSTIMNEHFPQDRHTIDLMLAHLSGSATERAYNRAAHMKRRRELAEAWANMLLDGMSPAIDLLNGPRK
jgi:integrase